MRPTTQAWCPPPPVDGDDDGDGVPNSIDRCPNTPRGDMVDAYGCTAKGKVASVSAATGAKFALLPPDNATGNFTKVVQRIPVRIAVDKPCSALQPLRPGMSVNVHVATK